MWPMLAMAGLGMLQGKVQRDAQADANKANAKAAAAQTQFSPYTKMGAGSFQAAPIQSSAGAMLGGAAQGAVAGLNLSQSYNKAQADMNMMNQNPNNMSMSNNQMASHINGLAPQAQSPWAMASNPYGSKNA